jgi:hypothetical protein
MLNTSTLRPGLLVSLKTSIAGNVNYKTLTLEGDHITETGERRARWETERTVTDPVEHEAAIRARSLARSKIQCVCANSAFGLLCPESKASELAAAVDEARAIVDAFNRSAGLTRLSFNLIAGKIAPDDVEAIRAINSEMSDLMASMAQGLSNLDVSKVRDAANKARSVGAMLTPEAQERVKTAIDVARKAARQIVSAGEEGAVEIDRASIRKVLDARTAFLDLEDGTEVEAPQAIARPVEWTEEDTLFVPVTVSSRTIDLD